MMVEEVTKEEFRFLKYFCDQFFSPLDMNIHSPGLKIMPDYSANDLALLSIKAYCYLFMVQGNSGQSWKMYLHLVYFDLIKMHVPFLEQIYKPNTNSFRVLVSNLRQTFGCGRTQFG